MNLTVSQRLQIRSVSASAIGCLRYSGSVMRRLQQSAVYLVLWISLGTGMSLHAQQQQPVLGILEVNGIWQLNGQQGSLKAGQKLYAGDKVSTEEYNYANSITVVHFSDGSRTRIACEHSEKNPCRGPYVVSAPDSNADNQRTSLLKAALNLLLGNPPAVLSHDSVTMSRGKYVVAVREDLVNFADGNGISLNGRIPTLPSGIYTIETSNADQNQAKGKTQISVDAGGGWQSSVPVPAPGLYAINVTDANGDLRANLLLLFVKAPQYPSARQSFDGVKSQADAWQGVNAQSDEDTLLRAILVAMSQSI
jgi:hypothetical protein